MSGLEQLEQEVKNLSREDLAKFRDWFVEFDWKIWDEKIDADLAAGKLDRLISEARSDFKAGKANEL